jgi:TetR/AcrR family transcriptional regulator, cholesterol catabolism regulator
MTEIDNKERIKIQATELFMKYGVRSVSMDDIANSMGMSKKTIYHFYADKDELVDAVIQNEIKHTENCCEQDRAASENAIHEMFLAMDMVTEMFRSMNPAVLHDIQKYHPNAFLKFNKHKNDYLYTIIRENLVRGIREDLFREDINVDIISQFRAENLLLAFNPEFRAKVKHNLVEIEEELILHYLYGLANMKGHKMVLKYKQERTKKH